MYSYAHFNDTSFKVQVYSWRRPGYLISILWPHYYWSTVYRALAGSSSLLTDFSRFRKHKTGRVAELETGKRPSRFQHLICCCLHFPFFPNRRYYIFTGKAKLKRQLIREGVPFACSQLHHYNHHQRALPAAPGSNRLLCPSVCGCHCWFLTLMASTESYLSNLLMWFVMLVLRGAGETGWMTVASWDCCWYRWQ